MAAIVRNIHLKEALELHHYMGLNLEGETHSIAKSKQPLTKVICTIGPKTSAIPVLGRLLDSGMNVCRINMSHGTFEAHRTALGNLRQVLSQRPGTICGVLCDVSGEIRVGRLKNKKQLIEAGKEVNICCDPLYEGDFKMFSLDFSALVDVVKPGSSIIMSDGVTSMTVLSAAKDRKTLRVRANTDVLLEEQKFAYVPGASVDTKAVEFGVEQGVDFIAANVGNVADLRDLRALMGPRGATIGIIAKIASMAALENIEEILASPECAGILVSRGDLGVIIPEEQVFVAQKKIISTANVAHKAVITATQMLYSMIRAPRPTRAECTDVANAVLDGCDAVVLSGETEQGDYPVEATEMMVQICQKADQVVKLGDYSVLFEDFMEMNREFSKKSHHQVAGTPRRGSISGSSPQNIHQAGPASKASITETISAYAVRIAVDSGAQVLVTLTESGTTSRVVAKYRPRVPVLCITSSNRVAGQLTVSRAAVPFVVTSIVHSDALIAEVLQKAKEMGLCTAGGKAVAVLGDVEGVSGSTNCFKIVSIP